MLLSSMPNYIGWSPGTLGIFATSLTSTGKDQKKSYRLSVRVLALYYMLNPALGIVLRS